MNWKSITVKQYLELKDALARENEDEVSRAGYAIMALKSWSYDKVNNLPAIRFLALVEALGTLLKSKPLGRAKNRLGWHRINYDVYSMPFRNFIEIQHWIKSPIEEVCHKVLASAVLGNDSTRHSELSRKFLNCRFIDVLASAELILKEITKQNKIFGAAPKEEDDEPRFNVSSSAGFLERYGWIYSATLVAKHRGIKLEEAYELKTVQARNDLLFLSGLSEYEKQSFKDATKE